MTSRRGSSTLAACRVPIFLACPSVASAAHVRAALDGYDQPEDPKCQPFRQGRLRARSSNAHTHRGHQAADVVQALPWAVAARNLNEVGWVDRILSNISAGRITF
eukprot:s1316_g16.t1